MNVDQVSQFISYAFSLFKYLTHRVLRQGNDVNSP